MKSTKGDNDCFWFLRRLMTAALVMLAAWTPTVLGDAYTPADLIGKVVAQTIYGGWTKGNQDVYQDGSAYFTQGTEPDQVVLHGVWGRWDLTFTLTQDGKLELVEDAAGYQALADGTMLHAAEVGYFDEEGNADINLQYEAEYDHNLTPAENPSYSQTQHYRPFNEKIQGVLTKGSSVNADDIFVDIEAAGYGSYDQGYMIFKTPGSDAPSSGGPMVAKALWLCIFAGNATHDYAEEVTGQQHSARGRINLKDQTKLEIYNFANEGWKVYGEVHTGFPKNNYISGDIHPCEGTVAVHRESFAIRMESQDPYMGYTTAKFADEEDVETNWTKKGKENIWFYQHSVPYAASPEVSQTHTSGYNSNAGDGYQYQSVFRILNKGLKTYQYCRYCWLRLSGKNTAYADNPLYIHGTFTAALQHKGAGDRWAKADGGTLETDADLKMNFERFALVKGKENLWHGPSTVEAGPYDLTMAVANSLDRFGADAQDGVYVGGTLTLGPWACALVDHVDLYLVTGRVSDISQATVDAGTGLDGALDVTSYGTAFECPGLPADFWEGMDPNARRQWLQDNLMTVLDDGTLTYNQHVPAAALEAAGMGVSDDSPAYTTFAKVHYKPQYAVEPTFHALASRDATTTALTTVAADDTDADALVEYYNLQGMKVQEPLTPGTVYLRRQGRTVTKVVAGGRD